MCGKPLGNRAGEWGSRTLSIVPAAMAARRAKAAKCTRLLMKGTG